MSGTADDWAGRNAEETDRQRRVDRAIEREARGIRFFGREMEPGLHNHMVGVVRPNRPAEHFMDAVHEGRVQQTDKHLPGLGPTLAEVAAQRRMDAAQAQQLPERRETDRVPVVAAPEQMSDERNARLFPTGPSNDDDRGR